MLTTATAQPQFKLTPNLPSMAPAQHQHQPQSSHLGPSLSNSVSVCQVQHQYSDPALSQYSLSVLYSSSLPSTLSSTAPVCPVQTILPVAHAAVPAPSSNCWLQGTQMVSVGHPRTPTDPQRCPVTPCNAQRCPLKPTAMPSDALQWSITPSGAQQYPAMPVTPRAASPTHPVLNPSAQPPLLGGPWGAVSPLVPSGS